ncbi:HlyD family efflux transporter periplasmic adaptor subunit [Neptuniibacter pectenicola]|uniref:HlyD family efflux transporter periplasmic adaptor subunit n=1 Tax=Neptuniibacter pectenicola TaxID=1806669 RepID=A0ABU9TUL1_9GAMM
MELQADTSIDSGLQSLITTSRVHQLPAEAPQIQHQFGVPGEAFGTTEILRAVKSLGFKTRLSSLTFSKLNNAVLQAILVSNAGEYFVLAKVAHASEVSYSVDPSDIDSGEGGPQLPESKVLVLFCDKQQQGLIGAKARNRQLKAQLDELEQQNQALIARTRSENLQELLQTDREYLSLSQELNKANDLNKKQILISPVNGVVQELVIHTIGGVATEAKTLMKIVPENQQLEVEAWLENKDIGFVTTNQTVEVKIHTCNFTKYGIIDGHVETISSDAAVDEKRGPIYKAKVLLTKSSLMVDGREVELVPDMGGSAEIKIGKRLLIEYITAPLLWYKSESLSEK